MSTICFDGGLVGGPQLPIPTDPARARTDFNDKVGCNRLFCPQCKSDVRHVDHRRISGWLDEQDKRALYSSVAPESTTFVTDQVSGDHFRVYFCRCSAKSIAGQDDVDLTDYGWHCAGHP